MKNCGLDYVSEYDDEYDDTYDSHNVGAVDHDSADELFAVKRFAPLITSLITIYLSLPFQSRGPTS